MTLRITQWILVAIVTLSLGAIAPFAFAHGDEVHEEKTELSVEQMEKMITLLNQVVLLLTQYKTEYGATASINTIPVEHHDEGESHDHDAPVTPAATLVIEIEPHNDKTHAHVRYTDKPEEMFFVDPAIGDEDGIVAAIAAKTGLSADAVRSALKYMQ